VLGLVLLLATFGWFVLGSLETSGSARVVVEAPRASTSAGPLLAPKPPELFIERSRGRISAFDYLHEQSSYSRAGILRSVGIAPERPLEVKSYPGAAAIGLPAARSRAGVRFGLPVAVSERATGSREPPALTDVAELSHYAAGVTSKNAAAGLLLRAAASSGALYPVDLYVAARDVRGLEPGIYYYEPHRHALVRVAGAFESIAGALAEPDAARTAPFVFVAGVTFDRTVAKYNVRSYRYVALDTGHVIANLVLVASALGYACRLETSFDDERLGRALSLDPEKEAALLVAVCDRARAHPNDEGTIVSPVVEQALLPERPDELELTRLSHRLTSVRLAKGAPRRAPITPSPRSTAHGVALPPVEPVAKDLFETIATRRSFREFSETPIRLPDLAGVVRDAAHTFSPLRGSHLVELYVLAARVEGLEPGAYRFDRERAVLEPRARGDRSSAIQSAALSQEVLGRAAAVFAWTLADRAGTIDGARDYRVAHIEAGLAGEVAYLSATARGLGLCGVGAYYDSEVDALLQEGTSRPRTLYLQGIGAR
jgi:SagB-type dehydrogenase family enzyme